MRGCRSARRTFNPCTRRPKSRGKREVWHRNVAFFTHLQPFFHVFHGFFLDRGARGQEGDSIFFQIAGRRVCDEVDRIPVGLLADIIAIHNEIGIRNDRVFRAPRRQ